MQISIRTCPATDAPNVQRFAANRLRSATQRLAHQLQEIEVDVTRESPNEGGRYICRIRGTLAEGGNVLVKRDGKYARSAVASTVERFRRSLVRTLDRRSSPRLR